MGYHELGLVHLLIVCPIFSTVFRNQFLIFSLSIAGISFKPFALDPLEVANNCREINFYFIYTPAAHILVVLTSGAAVIFQRFCFEC